MTRPRAPRGGHPPAGEGGQRLLTLPELAAQSQFSVRTLQRQIAAGKLRCLRFGRQVRFRQEDIQVWMSGAASL